MPIDKGTCILKATLNPAPSHTQVELASLKHSSAAAAAAAQAHIFQLETELAAAKEVRAWRWC